jgi:glycogen(starch) synthase
VVELGARLGLCSAGPVLVSYGGIEARKNSLGVLRAFLALRKRLKSATWVVIGGSGLFEQAAYREEFDRLLSEATEEDRKAVILAGVLSERELIASYQLADAVVCASLKEGFGMCALEALAAGAPLVASRRAPFTEHLDERCAVLVDPESPEQLVSALWGVLLRGRSDHARIGNGVERAKRFGWSRVAETQVRMYRELRDGAPRTPDQSGSFQVQLPTKPGTRTEARIESPLAGPKARFDTRPRNVRSLG